MKSHRQQVNDVVDKVAADLKLTLTPEVKEAIVRAYAAGRADQMKLDRKFLYRPADNQLSHLE